MFTIGADGMFSALLDPLGPTQRFGSSGDSTLYDYSAFNDLSLELLDAGGGLLASIDAGIEGVSEELSDIALLAGDYFIRIGGGSDAAQFYGLSLAFAEAETPSVGVPAPGMAVLFLMAVGAIGLQRRRA